MKAEHLIAFCTVGRYKNITKAAEALNTSQPGLSRQLAALQESVGEILYERTAFGIELTTHGKTLLPHACAVAQTFEEAENHLNKHKQQETLLNIGVSYHLAPSLTPRLLSLVSNTSKLSLNFHGDYSENLIDKLLHRQLDLCFVLQPEKELPQVLETSITVYGSDAVGFLVNENHALHGEVYASISDLNDETMILTKSMSAVYKNTLRSIEKHQVKPAKLIEVGSPSAVLACVQQGIGIGIGLANYLKAIANKSDVKFVQIDEGGYNIATLCIHHDVATLDNNKRQAIELLKTN